MIDVRTIISLLVVVSVLCVASESPAQETFRRNTSIAKKTTSSMLRMMPRALSMIPGNTPVIDELNLVEYQILELREAESEFHQSIGNLAQTTKSLEPMDRKTKYDHALERLDQEVSDILLPRQSKRLKQLAIQSLSTNSLQGRISLPNLLASPAVQRSLDVDQALINQLREKVKQENERILVEIENLKREAEANVLQLLSENQREQLRELIGEPFNFQGYRIDKRGRFRPGKDVDH